MARAVSKQEMRRNPLVDWLAATVRFVEAYRTAILAALVALVVSGAVGGGYWWYQERREGEAASALAQAYSAVRERQPRTPGPPDEAAKGIREVAQQYRGTRTGEEALIALGNLQFDAGKVDEALGTYGEYLSVYPRGRFRVMAGLGKASAQETKDDLQGAVQTLSELLDRDKNDPLAGEAYLSLARVYEGLNKPEDAMRVYGKVVEQFSQTQWEQRALQRMNTLKK
jgi:predicted negative regulator of RcsB-dependent stress response